MKNKVSLLLMDLIILILYIVDMYFASVEDRFILTFVLFAFFGAYVFIVTLYGAVLLCFEYHNLSFEKALLIAFKASLNLWK